MEALILLVLVALVVVGVTVAYRKGLLTGSPSDLRDAERAEEAARAAPHDHGHFDG